MDADADLTRLVPLALEIGIDPATLRKDAREGKVAAVRYGDRWFFTRHQVNEAIGFYRGRELRESTS